MQENNHWPFAYEFDYLSIPNSCYPSLPVITTLVLQKLRKAQDTVKIIGTMNSIKDLTGWAKTQNQTELLMPV